MPGVRGVVTGATSGIGAVGDAAMAARIDVTDDDGWRDIVAAVLDRLGRIDGLVGCAGVIRMGAIAEASLADFPLVMGATSRARSWA